MFQIKNTISNDNGQYVMSKTIDMDYGIRMARLIQEEIDWEIMTGFLEDTGWSKVTLDWPYATSSELETQTINDWCKDNLTGKFRGRDKIWMFENAQDASMFILRWS